jgi:hypothetical protein
MRILSMLLLGACLSAPLAAAQAAPVIAPAVDVRTSSSVEDVAGRCGRHAHFVPRHRNSRGRIVPGHCVADHRR